MSGTVSLYREDVALCHRCNFASDAVDAFKPCPHCDGRLWPDRVYVCFRPGCDFYSRSRKAFEEHAHRLSTVAEAPHRLVRKVKETNS